MIVRSPIKLQFAHRSDRGYARRINEDTSAAEDLLLNDGRRLILAAIADGMSGGRAGAEASQIAVTTAFGYLHAHLKDQALRTEAQWQPLLRAALSAANTAVCDRAHQTRRISMGTTLMLTAVIGRRAYITHVGDCRAYAVRPAVRRPQITQLTDEHTIVAEMVEQGTLSYAEARGHPQRHHLTRVLGTDSDVEPEAVARTLRANERLLLCSDGLPRHLSDTELARIVGDATTPEVACERLIALANARGGRDNLSAFVVAAAPTANATSSQHSPS